jgi:hypothetical protein
MSHAQVPGPPFAVRQEPDIIASRSVAKVTVLAIGVGVVSVFFSALLLETNIGGIRGNLADGARPRRAGDEIAHIEQTPAWGPPRGLDMQRAQREELTRYRWIDRDAGLVAIPIDRAMDLFEQRQKEPR